MFLWLLISLQNLRSLTKAREYRGAMTNRNMEDYQPDVKVKPRCKCGKVCRYYGKIGGYSVQCKSCNAKQSEKRRAASAKRRGE
jgi:hypothetical protein